MMELNLKMAKEIVTYFGGDKDTSVTLAYWTDGHSGEGLYVYCSDYPEDGAMYIGMTEDQKTISEYRKKRAEDKTTQETKDAWETLKSPSPGDKAGQSAPEGGAG